MFMHGVHICPLSKLIQNLQISHFRFSIEYKHFWCIFWVLLICTISGQIWTQYTSKGQYIVFMDTISILISSFMCSVNDLWSYQQISDHNILSRIQMDSVANLDVSDIDLKYLWKSYLASGTNTEYKPFLKVLLTPTIWKRYSSPCHIQSMDMTYCSI